MLLTIEDRVVHMKTKFDTQGIDLSCHQPDPLACYERITAYEQPEPEQRCLHCPVLSWLTALVSSGMWTEAERVDQQAFSAGFKARRRAAAA